MSHTNPALKVASQQTLVTRTLVGATVCSNMAQTLINIIHQNVQCVTYILSHYGQRRYCPRSTHLCEKLKTLHKKEEYHSTIHHFTSLQKLLKIILYIKFQ
jgi:hypothetical protein